MSWRKKLCYGLLTTTFVYGLLEGLLWVCGVKTITEVRDPFVGFQKIVPLFVQNGEKYVTHPLRTANFNVQRFAARKPVGTVRIFCLGGSTTYGHPYDARVAYPRCLQTRLERLEPSKRFEVINCGGVSYASYRLASLMDELVNLQSDVVVIHVGHNEFLERRTYQDIRDRPWWANKILTVGTKLRTVALAAKGFEICRPSVPPTELSADVSTILEQSTGLHSYHRDDELHRHVLKHLDFSLRRMDSAAHRAGAKVIFVKPASDLRGMSPFKSEYSVTSALATSEHQSLLSQARNKSTVEGDKSLVVLLEKATELDPRHADGQWLLGTVQLAAGQHWKARTALVRARDEDVCPLRATSDIEELIVRIAHETHAPLVDLGQRLEAICRVQNGHDCVGPESFLDHVHLTPDRHADLATELSRVLAAQRIVQRAELDEVHEQEWREEITSWLSSEERGLALHTLSMTLGWAGKDQEALRLSQQAVELVPKEGRVLTQLGRLQEKLGDHATALQSYRAAAQLDGVNPLVLFRLGSLLVDLGRNQDAKPILERAYRNTPPNAPQSFRIGLQRKLAECRSSTTFGLPR